MSEERRAGNSVVVLGTLGFFAAYIMSSMACAMRTESPMVDMVIGALPFIPVGIFLGWGCRDGAESEARRAGSLVAALIFLVQVSDRWSGSPLSTFLFQQPTATSSAPVLLTIAVALPALLCLAANALGVDIGVRLRRRTR